MNTVTEPNYPVVVDFDRQTGGYPSALSSAYTRIVMELDGHTLEISPSVMDVDVGEEVNEPLYTDFSYYTARSYRKQVPFDKVLMTKGKFRGMRVMGSPYYGWWTESDGKKNTTHDPLLYRHQTIWITRLIEQYPDRLLILMRSKKYEREETGRTTYWQDYHKGPPVLEWSRKKSRFYGKCLDIKVNPKWYDPKTGAWTDSQYQYLINECLQSYEKGDILTENLKKEIA